MSCIVYQTNKKTGVKYAYRSQSYRDPITKKPTSRRTYLGRVDPETGEIVGKAEEGKRNRSSLSGGASQSSEMEAIQKQLIEMQKKMQDMQEKIDSMTAQKKKVLGLITKLYQVATSE